MANTHVSWLYWTQQQPQHCLETVFGCFPEEVRVSYPIEIVFGPLCSLRSLVSKVGGEFGTGLYYVKRRV